MFGYVTVYRKGLDKDAQHCYQAYYCGLCQTLGQRFGTEACLILSYDMTFVAVLLSALYEPKTDYTQGRCIPHPLRANPRVSNEFLDYAADMSVVLAYYNAMDDWQDDHRSSSLHLANRLEPHLPAIRKRWPRQCRVIAEQLSILNQLERSDSHDLDALCSAFGILLGTVTSCREDFWQPVLQELGRGLGGFIYLMDAYDDLDKDRKKHTFNALSELQSTLSHDAFETRCEELLTSEMGRCARQFELLPILKDTPEGALLYNTIYSGVWCRYAPLKRHREGHKHD